MITTSPAFRTHSTVVPRACTPPGPPAGRPAAAPSPPRPQPPRRAPGAGAPAPGSPRASSRSAAAAIFSFLFG